MATPEPAPVPGPEPAATVPAEVPEVERPEVERPEAAAAVAESLVLDRVALVGASVTAGFGARLHWTDDGGLARSRVLTLADVLAAALPAAGAVTGHGSETVFLDPDARIAGLLEAALAEEPTLLVGADLLFWFGYGYVGAPRGSDEARDQRLARLERGLALLESCPCPIRVGDLPDMSAAANSPMLSIHQVPTPETLAVLNARIAAWAAERPDVEVLPLADLVRRVEAGERLGLPGPGAMLRPDRLHPTGLGLVGLGLQLVESLVGEAPPVEVVLERLRAG